MNNYNNLDHESNNIPRELALGSNLLRLNKVFNLPGTERGTFLSDGSIVEIILLAFGSYSVESKAFPIRFGSTWGNRVIFNTCEDALNINPKFVFDYNKQHWVLINAGYVCFAEQELIHKTNHTLR